MKEEDKERIEKVGEFYKNRFKNRTMDTPDESFVEMTIEYFGLMSGDIISGYELAKRLEPFYNHAFNKGKIEGFNEYEQKIGIKLDEKDLRRIEKEFTSKGFNEWIEAAIKHISDILERADFMDDYRDGLEKLKKTV